jgi:hypothetical protein
LRSQIQPPDNASQIIESWRLTPPRAPAPVESGLTKSARVFGLITTIGAFDTGYMRRKFVAPALPIAATLPDNLSLRGW